MGQYVINSKNLNITPLFIGHEACQPEHKFGPFVRECYLIHFCIKGKGVLINKDGNFNVTANKLFVIRPNEVTTYIADKSNPWEYIWIAFNSNTRYFDSTISVFDTPQGLDDKLIELLSEGQPLQEGCLALIYDLIYRTSQREENHLGDEKTSKIRRYIKYNYMLPITINSLANNFGFERSYLYRIFKARYGIGIKDYITDVRLKKGMELLKRGFSVKESAHMVGYEDEFNFSKIFKAKYGVNPSTIRKSI